MATEHIGLIATASTTYTEPYNLARQFASLDHISNGRIGWNIVTTWSPQAGSNFGGIGQVSHADRYERAEEYMEVVKGLWDSWADDAVLDDRNGGRYADRRRVRPIGHSGAHYKVAGPLNMPRSPQGRPVLVQAGSSDTGRQFAARHAEAVFTAHLEKATAKDLLRGSEIAGERLRQGRASRRYSAGLQSGHRIDRGRGQTLRRRTERTDRSRDRPATAFAALWRPRLLASGIGQTTDASRFPGPERGRSGAQPHRGHCRIRQGAVARPCDSCWRNSPALAVTSRLRERPSRSRISCRTGSKTASRTAST